MEVTVKMASPLNLVAPTVNMALPPNYVAAAVKMVDPPSRASVFATRANPSKHVAVIGESRPNKVVEAVGARSHGLICRINRTGGAMENPARKRLQRRFFRS